MHFQYVPRSRAIMLALMVLLAAGVLLVAFGGHLAGVGHLFAYSPQWGGFLS